MDDNIIKYNEYNERIKFNEKVISEYKIMMEDMKNKINEVNNLLKDESAIIEGYNTFKLIKEQLKELEKKYTDFNQLEREKIQIETSINILRKETQLELRNLQFKYNDVLLRYNEVENNVSKLRELEKCLQEIGNLKEKIKFNDEEIQKSTQKIAEYKVQLDNYNKKTEELKENYKAILQTDAKCPLCNSPLDENKKSGLLNNIKKEINDIGDKVYTIKDEILKEQNNIRFLKKRTRKSVDASK